jgi:hypothetical protein
MLLNSIIMSARSDDPRTKMDIQQIAELIVPQPSQ